MIKNINYINIREALSRTLRHPLLQDITLEQGVQYVLDFIGIFGLPKMYQDKEFLITIKDFKGLLPCDLVSVNQVKDCKTKRCLRSMTDTFSPIDNKEHLDATFKTQGNIIFTSFQEGDILISYKAIPVDDEGLPMLIDNSVFLKCLDAYIKKESFYVLFDLSKISQQVLQHAEQQYAWLAGQLQSEFTIPSTSELESIKNMWTTLLQRTTDFNNGFKNLGTQEYIKVQ